MDSLIISFFILSCFSLIINSIRDLMTSHIDERYNYTTYGALYMIIAFLKPSMLKIFGLIILGMFIILISKKILAEGDFAPIGWIILAFGVINIPKLIIWFWVWVFLTMIYVLIMRANNIKKAPYYPVFALSYIITLII